jgi:tetratricopeptide (TPR) repeat protein
MARAAVRAKQAQAAQAHAAANASRKQRKHASGGNPNQDLFFSRLRRRQKWVFLALAIIFGVTFAAVGVGSGAASGLQQVWSDVLGSGSNAVGQAQNEIKTNPAKGYRDLATAYQQQGDVANAIIAMQSYLKLRKHDSLAWAQLGGYQKQQGDTAASQYQQVLQSTQLQSPGSALTPAGALGTQLGTNPLDQYYSQQNQNVSGPLLQQAFAAYKGSLTAFQSAAKYASRANRPELLLSGVFTAAQLAGDTTVALKTLQRYVDLAPNSPTLTQIEAQCKQLGGTCLPRHQK